MRTEIVRFVDGRLFDGESYERTDALGAARAGESGYYVMVWGSEAATSRRRARPRLLGPFPSRELAFATANHFRRKMSLLGSPRRDGLK